MERQESSECEIMGNEVEGGVRRRRLMETKRSWLVFVRSCAKNICLYFCDKDSGVCRYSKPNRPT